jgi:hypothetical protein
MVMVMLPWNDPITLQRAWCVFEAYACLQTQSRFEVALNESESQSFVESIISDFGTLNKMLATINSAKSKATYDIDRDMIHDAISELVGFTKLVRTICKRI